MTSVIDIFITEVIFFDNNGAYLIPSILDI